MKTLLITLILIGTMSSQVFVEPPIDFPNTPVKVALETIFLKTSAQYDIEADPSNYSNVTLTINERQELDTVLNLILEPKNLEFVKDDSGIYHIKKKAEDSGILRGRTTKLYTITGMKASDAEKVVKSFISKNGMLSIDEGTNSLILTDDYRESYDKMELFINIIKFPAKTMELSLFIFSANGMLY